MRKLSKEERKRRSELFKKIGKMHKGKIVSKETKLKISETRKKLIKEGKIINNHLNLKEHAMKGYKPSNEKIEKAARASMKAQHIKPNIPETIMDNLLQKHFPNEWKYVGDGQVWFGRKNPDFINCNGKKEIIEVFGDYWHKHRKNIPYHQTEQGTIEHYKKYGFKIHIFWEKDIKNPEKHELIINNIYK